MNPQDNNNQNPQNDTLKQQYQDILNKYSEQLQQTQDKSPAADSPVVDAPPETTLPPLPKIEDTPELQAPEPPGTSDTPFLASLQDKDSPQTLPSPQPVLSLPSSETVNLAPASPTDSSLSQTPSPSLDTSPEETPSSDKSAFFDDILSKEPSESNPRDLEKVLSDQTPQTSQPLESTAAPFLPPLPPKENQSFSSTEIPTDNSDREGDYSSNLKSEIPYLDDDKDSSSDEKSGPNIAKIFFFFSLVVFLSVLGLIAYNLFKDQSSLPTTQLPPPALTSPTQVPAGSCVLNDKVYEFGESFSAADGCNTCTCAEGQKISCTEMACEATPIEDSTTSAQMDN